MPNHFLRATMESIETVLPGFRYVKIDMEKLRQSAEANAFNEFTLPRWDFCGCQPKSNKAFPSHCFFWSAINFSFDNSRRNGDGQLMKFKNETIFGDPVAGAFAMEACFYRLFGEMPIDAVNILPFLDTFSKFKKYFKGKNSSMPMLRARWELLLEARFILETEFEGDVRCLLEEGGYRAFGVGNRKGIVELLVERFPLSFGDDKLTAFFWRHLNPQTRFCFHKRAQLFALMYHGRAVSSDGELTPLEDVEDIGPIADYELPKSYASEGILVYQPDLQATIDSAMHIERHSQAELEIRLAFMKAHLEELKIINELRAEKGLPPIHVGHLDCHRWKLGRKNKTLNHHLCFTTDY